MNLPIRRFLVALIVGLATASSSGIAQNQPSAPAASAEFPPETKAPSAKAPTAPFKPPTLKLTYASKSAEYTLQDLNQLDQTAIDVYNAHTKTTQHYAGVPLIALLAKLGVPDKPHGKDFRLYIVAEGSDGYQVVYSLGEITPDVHDGTVIVAVTLGVDNLDQSGPFQLVATGEKRPARWVHNLVSIRVLQAP